jgi:hypothetical protein
MPHNVSPTYQRTALKLPSGFSTVYKKMSLEAWEGNIRKLQICLFPPIQTNPQLKHQTNLNKYITPDS